MTDIATLSNLTAAAIGRALAAGEDSPVALAEHLLEQIDAASGQSVFLAVTGDRAMREARAAEKRLAAGRPLSALDGVPIAWKDLIDMAGEVTTAGSATRRDAPPAADDAPIVANATGSGMVSLGKLNLTEFAYSGLGHNPHFGTPANPHDRSIPRSPGGSSSGAAVAVASGLAPCAIGTDTGGSVRVPSAFNGLVGYKSSEGRIDKSAIFPLSYTFDTVGPLTRSVEDCVLLDMTLRGAPATDVCRQPIEALRLFVPETIVLDDLDPAVSENFENSLLRLQQAGAQVTRGPLEIFAQAAAMATDLGTIQAAEAYIVHRDLVDGPDVASIDRRVVARIMRGKQMSAADLLGLQRARIAMMRKLADHLDGRLLATPTVAMVAPGSAPLDDDDDLFHTANLKALRNTLLGNFLNLPGLAIPSGTDDAGLPTSTLISSIGDDDDRLLGFGLTAERFVRSHPD
ncbi:MAG: amidase [Hyphomicrobiales bacterium]|nr:amidase [Hyphomicrobiales bacterium]